MCRRILFLHWCGHTSERDTTCDREPRYPNTPWAEWCVPYLQGPREQIKIRVCCSNRCCDNHLQFYRENLDSPNEVVTAAVNLVWAREFAQHQRRCPWERLQGIPRGKYDFDAGVHNTFPHGTLPGSREYR